MMKNYKNIQGGYSDTRLWPCYFFYFGSILGLSPIFGGVNVFIAVSIPAFAVAFAVARYQEKHPKFQYIYDSKTHAVIEVEIPRPAKVKKTSEARVRPFSRLNPQYNQP